MRSCTTRRSPSGRWRIWSSPGRRVRVVSNTGAPGLAGARNCGLTHTSGDFIASCDDDDRWHATKLTRQMSWLEEHPDYLVVGAGIRLPMPSGPFDWPGRTATITHADLLLSRYKELHSSTLLIRREAFEKAGAVRREPSVQLRRGL